MSAFQRQINAVSGVNNNRGLSRINRNRLGRDYAAMTGGKWNQRKGIVYGTGS